LTRLKVISFAIAVTCAIVFAVNAQADTCAAIVRAAVASTALECADVQIGEVCYGSAALEVETSDNTAFTRPGAVTRITAVESLRTQTLDADAGEWGIAVMRAQANTPEQNLTYVVFGDVSLTSTATEAAPVPTVPVRVTFDAGANVRAEPREDAALTGALTAGAIVPATGRLADGSWFRVFLADSSGGWVRADLIRIEGEIELLPVVTPDDPAPTSLYSPMLVFNFESSINDSQCSAMPHSGILAQTANDEMRLIVNGVDVRLDGTAYLQAKTEGGVMVTALEGLVYLAAAEVETIVPIGFQVEVRWNPDQLALGAPRDPLQAAFVRLQALPTELLPRAVAENLDFNLLDVVTPAAPGVDPLASLVADSPCTVAAVNDEGRMRTGPGRDYPVRGGLFTGESANPEARAVGSDGATWWRLAEGMWVRSDIVLTGGDCRGVPLVDVPSAAE
jgi:uncharacterized protein YraI